MLKIILSFLALLILVGGLVLGIWLVREKQIFKSKADATLEPVDVQVTNLSESSFTISWLTPVKETTGFVEYGEDQAKLGSSAADTRVGYGTYKTHYVVLEKLKPSTKYFFEINSGGRKFKTELNGAATLSQLPQPPSPSDPLFGKALPNTIVYIYLDNDNQPIASVLTAENGTWTLDLSALRPGGQGYYNPKPDDQIKIMAQNGDKLGEYSGKLGIRKDSLNLSLDTTFPANSSKSSSPSAKVSATPLLVPSQAQETDLNGDNQINAFDVSIFIKMWMNKDPKADLNKDGVINNFDYAYLIQRIGK